MENNLVLCAMVSKLQTEAQRVFSAKVTTQVEATTFVLSDSTLREIILDEDIYQLVKKIANYEQENANQLDTPKS